tara:strand:+ start:490 stop:705 length:216 start_codon:yes stop_codon:yes gene_type:complete
MDKTKAVIFVTPCFSTPNKMGQELLSNLSFEQCKKLEIPFGLEFTKNCDSLADAMTIIKDKMLKIQEILNE